MWVLTAWGAASGIRQSASRLFLASLAPCMLRFSFSAALGNWFLRPPAPLLCFSLLTTRFHLPFILPRVPPLARCVSAACKLRDVLYGNPRVPV